MKQILDPELIQSYMKSHKIDGYFENKDIPKSIIQYEKGEFLCSPLSSSKYIQFILNGEVSIHYIREDGTSYSLATFEANVMLGEQQLFSNEQDNVYAMALTTTTCIAISIDCCRELLLNDKVFLRKSAETLSKILSTITKNNASNTDLESRVYNYMKYRCKDYCFTGLEKAAFHLHCSNRQLQRIMNKLENNSVVQKVGKGSYKLLNDR